MAGQHLQALGQLLQVIAECRLTLLPLAEQGVQDSVTITQFLQALVLGLQGLARALCFVVVLLRKAGQQGVGLMPGMLAAAAHRAGFAWHQRRTQGFDAFAAGQALAIKQFEGELERLFGGIALVA